MVWLTHRFLRPQIGYKNFTKKTNNSKMKKIILIALLLTGCETTPPIKTPPWIGQYKNACLPEAITMTEGLNKVGVQAKVLKIDTKEWSHAVSVYNYKNQTWVWDSYWKSIMIQSPMEYPKSVAILWVYRTQRGTKVIDAKYLE